MTKQFSKRGNLIIAVALGVIVAMVVTMFDPFHVVGEDAEAVTVVKAAADEGRPKLCNPDPPEYPGCTEYQINHWEAGTWVATRNHYAQNRWGQQGFNWSNLGNAHDDKLRRLYNDAVDRFQAQKRANPVALTWNGFKSDAECSSGGIWGGLWTITCRFNQAMDAVIPDVNRVILACTGLSAVLTGVGLVFSLVTPAAAAGTTAATAIGCAIEQIFEALGFLKRADRRALRAELAVAQARIAVEEAVSRIVPFGTVARLTPAERLDSAMGKALAPLLRKYRRSST